VKKRILFVDDEPNVLEGLRHRLRRLRNSWDMRFVESGHEALEALDREPFDMIVSDMRMPRMDGAALLRLVQERHPAVVRIVLSGHADNQLSVKAVPVAHQFLTKPCAAGVLENVVERACNLKELVGQEQVRRIVGGIETLPPMPRVYTQLVSALADENVAAAKVTAILKQDMAMCAKLLQMVNSAFFRLSRTITSIDQAVVYLGFDAVRQLALAVEVFAVGRTKRVSGGLSLDALQRHSLLVARIASQVLGASPQKEDAFVAGLLHDIGTFLAAVELPEHLEAVATDVREHGGEMHAVEARLHGVTHAEIGAYLLGIWGLPYPVIEAVANHHAPGRVAQQGLDVLAAVHVAEALAGGLTGPVVSGVERETGDVDRAYLDGLGVGHELEAWREMAGDLAGLLSEG
jgi:HD-like signal output (HDOD) protein